MVLFRKFGWIALLWLVAEVLFLYFTDSRWLLTFLFYSPVEVFQKNYPDYWWLVFGVVKGHVWVIGAISVAYCYYQLSSLLKALRYLAPRSLRWFISLPVKCLKWFVSIKRWWCSLPADRELKKNAGLLIFSLLLALVLAEICLRWVFKIEPGQHTYSPWFSETDSLIELEGMQADSDGILHVSSKAAEYVNHRLASYSYTTARYEQKENVCLEVYGLEWNYFELQSDTSTHPFAAWLRNIKKKPPQQHSYFEQQVLQYSLQPINQEGFRSISFKAGDTTRKKILLLGDSFTWGHYSENKLSSFADLLLQKGYWVYNTGISGADVPQYVAIAQKYVPVLKPDVVVVNFFMGNDISYYPRKVEPYRPYHYMTNASNLISCPNGIYFNSPQEAYKFVCAHYRIPLTSAFNRFCTYTALGTAAFMALKKYNKVSVMVPQYEDYWTKAAALHSTMPYANKQLTDLQKVCKENGSRLILVAIPEQRGNQLIKPEDVPELFPDIKYYTSPVQLSHYATDNGHYNESGHRIHAGFIDSLIKNYSAP